MELLKRASWLRRKFEVWVYRKYAVRYGPAMFQARDRFYYIASDGRVWKLTPTYAGGYPLCITLEHQ